MNTRVRFVVRPRQDGKQQTWCVYDKQTGSYPYQREGIGTIAQKHATEKAAQAEADRVTAWYDQDGGAR